MAELASKSTRLDLLWSDKAPFLITLFLGALAWLVNYSVQLYDSAAVLEYALVPIGQAADLDSYRLTVHNISKTRTSTCVNYTIAVEPNRKAPNLQKMGSGLTSFAAVDLEFTVERLSLSASAGALRPRAGFWMDFKVAHGAVVSLSWIPNTDCSSTDEKGSPVLLERSPQTWLIANSLKVMWGALGAWAVVLLWTYFTAAAASRRSGEGGATPAPTPAAGPSAAAPTEGAEGG